VVAHEWGHYLSNRLISNANGLNANQGRGLGEGWGDFVALLTFVKEEDRNATSNAGFGGTYGVTPYPDTASRRIRWAARTTRPTCSTMPITTA
jgi:hypothetical protein